MTNYLYSRNFRWVKLGKFVKKVGKGPLGVRQYAEYIGTEIR